MEIMFGWSKWNGNFIGMVTCTTIGWLVLCLQSQALQKKNWLHFADNTGEGQNDVATNRNRTEGWTTHPDLGFLQEMDFSMSLAV
jgi:hypothetical protein